MIADTCAEVPTREIVTYNIMRLRRTGYLPRFDGYLRQLGFGAAERQEAMAGPERAVRELSCAVADRETWGHAPDEHLKISGCQLATCVIDSAESTLGVAPLDTASLLDFYASLTTDVRMFIGVDPYRESTLRTALALRRHPAFAGIALIPYLAGVPLSEPVFEPALRAADKHGLAVWAHCSAHFRPDVAYNIEHPAHADTILRRHPELRLLIGHAGWPWVDQACAIAARFSNVAIEFSTFPPRLILDPGWSLSPLLARSRDLAGRIFFGSGAVSAVHPFTSRISQLSELPLGEQHDSWLGAGYASWLSSS